MSYRPITDFWFLARPKVPYYGAYPNGFLERARALLGVHRDESVLHVCGGAAKRYPTWRRYAPNDRTLDLDPRLKPDYLQDAREPLPPHGDVTRGGWAGVLADPPYTPDDARHYRPSPTVMPTAGRCLRNGLAAVRPGGRVGVLHYLLPRPPKDARFIAAVAVIVGYDNRVRVFSVFERASN